jgi:hypothetical protein
MLEKRLATGKMIKEIKTRANINKKQLVKQGI